EMSNVQLGWRLLGMLLGAPLLVGMLAGGALGNLTDPMSKSPAASFVLARPISSFAILKAKLLLAALVTAAIWVLLLGFIALLLLRPGFAESIAHVAGLFPPWKAIGLPLLILALLVFCTWKNLIEGLWITLTGRKWVENATAFSFAGLLFAV